MYETTTIRDKFHDALVEWQKAQFPECELLVKNWDKHFKGIRPFTLEAKVATDISTVIDVGRFAGQDRFESADAMDDDVFHKALAIIKAQCSTELGSVQQHRMSLEQYSNDKAQYSIMRIMAEELRHAYQMLWVLDQDKTWNRGGQDVAKDMIEELLAMQHGQHVLDAFNVDFDSFLDNVVFAAIIDMVGKYQLDMQRSFSYAPMARSMGPMYMEEGFHLGAGKRHTTEIAVAAALGEGDHSLDDVQRAFNKWLPRGLEMFGDERGGQTNLSYGFKTMANGEAQGLYYNEVCELIRDINARVARAYNPDKSIPECRELVDTIMAEGSDSDGVRYEDLIKPPARGFFRWRGPEAVAMRPIDTDGNLLTHDGQPFDHERYVAYLRTVLPDPFFASEPFARFTKGFVHHAQATH